MSDQHPEMPIVVNASSAPAEIETTIGQLIPAIGGLLICFGLVTAEKWAALVGPLTIIVGLLWRLWRTRRNHAKLVVAASAAPDSVAQVKG